MLKGRAVPAVQPVHYAPKCMYGLQTTSCPMMVRVCACRAEKQVSTKAVRTAVAMIDGMERKYQVRMRTLYVGGSERERSRWPEAQTLHTWDVMSC